MTRAREPIFNVPAVVLALAAILAAIHIGQSFLSEETKNAWLVDFAFVPAREISWFGFDVLKGIVDRGPTGLDENAIDQYQLARYLLAQDGAHPWTLLTYAGLHEGWLHLGLNVVVLAALGTPVARRFRAPRFLALVAAGAIAGALMHLAVHPEGVAPLIGASASVSACMGAAARFVFDPIARLGGGAPSLGASLRNRTVITFTLGWFFANAISGLGANPSVLANASIAWEAHIGGFLLGFLAFALFDPVRRHTQTP
ncbi:Membrane associated serine protease, rhomboid family [Rhizobiales bacterium GAS191]|nr:Membrane associated serine protease, rhomboid family [Rhizobiales bacterium GAS191]SEE45844.1 Membrane associated serine protease, rhomboid family [Rhizobiales bacterium GAS188]